MNLLQKKVSKKSLFIDYIPAVLQATTGNNWMIVFYVKEPGKEKLKRFRRRVPKLKSKTERRKLAARMCGNINEKLTDGWTPFFDGYEANEYKKLIDVMDVFLEQCERRLKDHLFRPDSYRAYLSFANNIKNYLKEQGKENLFCVELTKDFIIKFLDYIYFDKKRTARTANNYLSFFSTLCTFLLDRKLIPSNPTNGIQKRKVGKKKREILPATLRNEIFKYLASQNPNYLTVCLTVYFCFIRRTEITKLLVKHVDLKNDTIFIPAEISKNKKDGVVTIPRKLKIMLVKHLENACMDDYLFSEDFTPGTTQLQPKKISDEWSKMRKVLKFANKYQFYSLKDTGITEMFLLGVPSKKIRDQARHYDIKITESYTPRNYEADKYLIDLDFNF